MSIYLDAVWLLNFLLDFMLLSLTSKLIKLNTKNYRLITGALVASLIVPFTIYFPETFITSFPAKILFSVAIILTTFGFKNIIQFIRILFLFYFISFSIGGGLIAVHFLLQNPISASHSGILTQNTGYGDPVSWLFILIGFPLVWMFTKRRMDSHSKEKIRYDSIYSVSLHIRGKSYNTNGYIDSGNQLIDPFTKKPVVICDEEFLKLWFLSEDWKHLKKAFETWELDNIPKEWIDDIVVIPYQGVQGGNNFIFAIKPDLIVINYEEQQIQTKRFLVGIQFGQLSADGSYQCLLHPELVQGSIEYSA